MSKQENVSQENTARRGKIKLPTKSPHVDYFMPMLEGLDKNGELNELIKMRVVKSCELLDDGVALYPNGYERPNPLSDLLAHADLDEAALASLSVSFVTAGRIMSMRSFGKAVFFDLLDFSGRIQAYAAKEDISEEDCKILRRMNIGDVVGVTGTLFRTQKGELTIKCSKVGLLTRNIRPLPEKYHGLKDVEMRYRQRYVDFIVNPRAMEIAVKRAKIVSEFRKFMEKEGFLEVETPMMHPIAGGATARPFSTHHNALDMELFMRIAPELYLKRLLVGGFEKVFEINRNFRNEGISTQHNPEFTMCEFYWCYSTFHELMDLPERLFAHIATEVCGGTTITYQGQTVDLTPGKWKRVAFREALQTIGGHSPELYMDFDRLSAHLESRGEKTLEGEPLGKLQAKLFDLDVEKHLVEPHFIYHYPTDISPLARRNDEDPTITDRFELFITGREFANGFSELNDPMDQRSSFEAQLVEKDAGDDEAHDMDEDYLRALEYGMPPAGGEGIGVDRMVMLMTDAASIREVILFPLLKAE